MVTSSEKFVPESHGFVELVPLIKEQAQRRKPSGIAVRLLSRTGGNGHHIKLSRPSSLLQKPQPGDSVID
jgi:hypothetical protein